MKVLGKLGILTDPGVGAVDLKVANSIDIGGYYLKNGVDILSSVRPTGEYYASLANEVALAVSNTFYDGPLVALDMPGMWLVIGTAVFRRATTGGRHYEAQLYCDDGTVIAAGSVYVPSANPSYAAITIVGVKSLYTRSVQVTLRAATSAGSASDLLTTRNAITTNNGTQIMAFRMAT